MIRILRPCLMFLALLCLILFYFVLEREQFVYPGAFEALLNQDEKTDPLPPSVISQTVSTPDGTQLEVWHLSPNPAAQAKRGAALFFSGDSGSLKDSLGFLRWLSEIGFIAYSFDYRGYGHSTGWPTEKGIYQDSETVFQLIQQQEKISPAQMVVVGISFGCGPAAYTAQKFAPRQLVLVAPYLSLPDCDAESFWYNPLMPKAWPEYPIKNFVQNLPKTKLLIAHGTEDEEIPFRESLQLISLAHTRDKPQLILRNGADHLSIFSESEEKIRQVIKEEFPPLS